MIKVKLNLKKFVGIFFILQLLVISLSIFLPTTTVLAATNTSDATKPIKFIPQISIPNSGFTKGTALDAGIYNAASSTMNSDLLAKYIITIYNYGLAIVGILATIVLMGAGIIWLTSGGDAGKITQAKEMISGSIIGVIILVCAWIILNTINPNLTNLAVIKTVIIQKVEIGCCDQASVSGKAEMTSSGKCKSGFSKDKQLNAAGICESENCCMLPPSPQNLQVCFMSIVSQCISPNTLKYDKCSNIQECKNLGLLGSGTMNCVGIEDSKKPVWDNNGKPITLSNNGQNDYWCYNGRVYPGLGKAGEPCGNTLYSKCTKGPVSGGPCNYDLFGGRSCGGKDEGFVCCKYESNGTLKSNFIGF